MRVRVLAVDYGEKRVGLAISDPLEITANPLAVLERRGSVGDVVAEITRIAREEQVDEVVVGLPVNMDGSHGPAAAAAEAFARELAARLDMPVHTYDERLTTVEAEGMAGPPRGPRSRRRGKRARLARGIDKLAAAVILRDYLGSRRSRAVSSGQ